MGTGAPSRAPDGTSPTGLAVSGDEVVVSTDTGVYRVAGDALELVWSPQQRWAVVPELLDVVTVSGDEAWIVTEDGSAEDSPASLSLQRVQVGRPDPVLVASLPASDGVCVSGMAVLGPGIGRGGGFGWGDLVRHRRVGRAHRRRHGVRGGQRAR